MHILPPLDHPVRQLFDVADVVAIATGEMPVHCNIYSLRRLALAAFKAMPDAKRIAYFRVNPSDDQLELVTFGRRGAWKREWRFGPIGRRAVLA